VVSIKPNTSVDLETRVTASPSGRLTLINMPLSAILFAAYELQDTFQVDNLPDWVRRDRFDVEAQAPRDVTIAFPGQGTALPAMLRGMLAERTKLVTHVEKRSMPMFALTLARADGRLGPHLTRSSVDCTVAPLIAAAPDSSTPPGCGNRATPTSFSGKGIPLDRLIRMIIAPRVRRQVIDRTGLQGVFDIELQFRAPEQQPAAATLSPDSDLPTIETAVQDQLGLKLQPVREPTDVLVIDHIEPPTAN
jgi:uncharacterized protein (TIGR03435 family)